MIKAIFSILVAAVSVSAFADDVQTVTVTAQLPERVVRGQILEAHCGPHNEELMMHGVLNYATIGDVNLIHREGNTLISERHLVTDPELCRVVNASQKIIDLSLNTIMGGSTQIVEARITSRGIKSLQVVEEYPGYDPKRDFKRGASDQKYESYVFDEYKAQIGNAGNAGSAQ